MKMNKKFLTIIAGSALILSSCENGDVDFPEYDYQTIYFSTPTPIRYITLGEDGEFNTDLDNQHRFEVYATLGGVNENRSHRWVETVIDNDMCNRIEFADGSSVKPLPSNYYSVSGTRIEIGKGSTMGCFGVQLTDAFFADPDAYKLTYVLPVRMVNASDSILEGKLKDGATPDILNNDAWDIKPMNYTLYAVCVKNQWHGNWLSRGSIKVDCNGEVREAHKAADANGYWENEEIVNLKSKNLNSCVRHFSLAAKCTKADGSAGEVLVDCDVVINIADNGAITFSTTTEDCTISGTGTYTYHGAGQAWGSLQRDKIELDYTYTIPYVVDEATGEKADMKVTGKETLVSRDRQSKFETFSYVMK